MNHFRSRPTIPNLHSIRWSSSWWSTIKRCCYNQQTQCRHFTATSCNKWIIDVHPDQCSLRTVPASVCGLVFRHSARIIKKCKKCLQANLMILLLAWEFFLFEGIKIILLQQWLYVLRIVCLCTSEGKQPVASDTLKKLETNVVRRLPNFLTNQIVTGSS